ncbi:MAG: TRAP transporter small permease subunit, partial [Alphaproteobacteria bacterium]|nr:TRAP transporter small permease subunit [Alphaproteobacteria bacterium]
MTAPAARRGAVAERASSTSDTPGQGGRRRLLPSAPPAPSWLTVIGDTVDWVIVAIGAAMILLVFFNVVSHLFGRDLAATIELCELLMVWVTFLGGTAAARRGAHMAITELLDKLSPPAR